jgi:hypothetical protein
VPADRSRLQAAEVPRLLSRIVGLGGSARSVLGSRSIGAAFVELCGREPAGSMSWEQKPRSPRRYVSTGRPLLDEPFQVRARDTDGPDHPRMAEPPTRAVPVHGASGEAKQAGDFAHRQERIGPFTLRVFCVQQGYSKKSLLPASDCTGLLSCVASNADVIEGCTRLQSYVICMSRLRIRRPGVYRLRL